VYAATINDKVSVRQAAEAENKQQGLVIVLHVHVICSGCARAAPLTPSTTSKPPLALLCCTKKLLVPTRQIAIKIGRGDWSPNMAKIDAGPGKVWTRACNGHNWACWEVTAK
jgi:hypothetical protein